MFLLQRWRASSILRVQGSVRRGGKSLSTSTADLPTRQCVRPGSGRDARHALRTSGPAADARHPGSRARSPLPATVQLKRALARPLDARSPGSSIQLTRLLLTSLEEDDPRGILQPTDVASALQRLRRTGVSTRLGDHVTLERELHRLADALRTKAHNVLEAEVNRSRRSARDASATMTQDRLQKLASERDHVKGWHDLCSSGLFFETLLMSRTSHLRTPTATQLSSLLDSFTSSSERKEIRTYNKFLALILRNFLVPVRMHTRRLSRLLHQVSHRNSIIQITADKTNHLAEDEQNVFLAALYDRNQPTTGVGLFNAFWKVTQANAEPNAESYSIGLAMQIRLAAWHVALRQKAQQTYDKHKESQLGNRQGHKAIEGGVRVDEPIDDDMQRLLIKMGKSETDEKFHGRITQALDTEPWKPIVSTLEYLHAERKLDIKHMNQLLWGAMHYDHLHMTDTGDSYERVDRRGETNLVWPSLRSVIDTYDRMQRNANISSQARQEALNPGLGPYDPLHSRSDERLSPLVGTKLARQFPSRLVPTRETYDIMILGLTERALLDEALYVFRDMTGNTLEEDQESDLLKFTRSDDHNRRTKASFSPSLRTFDAFFRGFAKYSVPSKLVKLDRGKPSRSLWEHETMDDDGNEAASSWNMRTLCAIVDQYLLIRPLDQLYPKGQAEGSARRRHNEHDNDRVRSADADVDYLDELVLRSQAIEAAGPTPNELFSLLTALRRTSGDDAEWVLAQFERIKRHFGPDDSLHTETTSRSGTSSRANANGWTGWHYTSRVQRVLGFLREKRRQQISARTDGRQR